jgi:primosomal protein N' (replication factor Y) (superfamily II helicase)
VSALLQNNLQKSLYQQVMSKNFVQVLLPLALSEAFTYASEIDVETGDVVKVEFGKKQLWGVVVAVGCTLPEKVAPEKIKKILEKNSRFKLSKLQLQFIEKIASYNLASRGLVLRAFIGILNSDKVKKVSEGLKQNIAPEKFLLKKLSKQQQEIVDVMMEKTSPSLSEERSQGQIFLLDGVTGSGKTEIYFSLIAQILSQAHKGFSQILILLPEIALTSQILLRFEEQFGFKPALWHSKISKKEKREIFYGVVEGSIQVLIGARSALLLPFKNLQLIVIDEEHDSSFKQEDVFNFHARDMAIVRAKLENFPVILSSATPALESYVNGLSGKYHHFILEQKFGQKNKVELLDLRREKMDSGNFLSTKLREEIAKNFAAKKQTLLFLNRRGYAPVTLCKTCGKKYECADCDFNLVLHKAKKKLICHHCGHHENLIHECKFCGEKDSLISVGAGVEKIVEEAENLFPQAKIALVTSDNVASFSDAESLVNKILNHEIDIIIGTQMISKGYDFPELTLIGIVDADAMLYSSELRALEKTYQMLTQVIGRAGRREIVGKVIIQTYNPDNFIFEKIVQDNKKDFYEFEMKNREALELPPFSKFAKFEISSFVENDAKNFAKKLIQNFPSDDKIEIFGPAPAPLQRLKNRHHFLVNLKTQKKVNLQKLISDVMQGLEIPSSVRVRIDVDPI